jgi:hypothetical protein
MVLAALRAPWEHQIIFAHDGLALPLLPGRHFSIPLSDQLQSVERLGRVTGCGPTRQQWRVDGPERWWPINPDEGRA